MVDRKSTRLNSSHVAISYAVFCLKKKNDVRRQRRGGRRVSAVSGRSSRYCPHRSGQRLLFFFNDTATTEIYTLSLHDALPIFPPPMPGAYCQIRLDRMPVRAPG